ncbi:hypothetical protein CPC08DRAFT_770192 [Agrocybe pediades]|nr:hypothetical protein CPC08DRAFT_770192 [Agrocybe pediades]
MHITDILAIAYIHQFVNVSWSSRSANARPRCQGGGSRRVGDGVASAGRDTALRTGWKTALISASVALHLIVRPVLELLGDTVKEKDIKVKEDLIVAKGLTKSSNPCLRPLANTLAIIKSRTIDTRLAACSWLTHTLPSFSLPHRASGSPSSYKLAVSFTTYSAAQFSYKHGSTTSSNPPAHQPRTLSSQSISLRRAN